MNIASALKNMRLKRFPKKEKTQGEIAALAGISQTYLSQIEIGNKVPSMEVIQSLCKVYKIPFELMVWQGMEISDVEKKKQPLYRKLKPVIDSLIEEIMKKD